jgi:hypothetical protein
LVRIIRAMIQCSVMAPALYRVCTVVCMTPYPQARLNAR